MTPEQIVALALKAGLDRVFANNNKYLVAFADLIESATREECAKQVEQDLYPDDAGKPYTQQYNYSIKVLAEKIRSGT